MSAPDDALEEGYKTLRQKYRLLRRKHKKLAGVALRLAEALEVMIKGSVNPEVSEILMSCSKLYPGLVEGVTCSDEEGEGPKGDAVEVGTGDIDAILEEPEIEKDATEEVPVEAANGNQENETSEKEYYEGFWSRPKIPRTPQV